MGGAGGFDRLGVVGLEKDEYLELLGRVVERAEVPHELPDDVRLPVYGHEHRVERQPPVVALCVRLGDPRSETDPHQARNELEHHRGQEHDVRARHDQSHRQLPLRQHADEDQHAERGHAALLPDRPAAGCRQVGALLQEFSGRPAHDVLAEAQDDRALDVKGGRRPQVDLRALAEPLDHAGSQLRSRRLAGRDEGAVAFGEHRHPALSEQHLRIEPAHERLVDLCVEQVDERQLPLLAERTLKTQAVHAAGSEKDLTDPLAGRLLAPERPRERLAVDQARGQQRLADRRGLSPGPGVRSATARAPGVLNAGTANVDALLQRRGRGLWLLD